MGLDAKTAKRFASHAREAKHRGSLAAIFNANEADFDEHLERGYAGLQVDRHRWDMPPATLFG